MDGCPLAGSMAHVEASGTIPRSAPPIQGGGRANNSLSNTCEASSGVITTGDERMDSLPT